MCVHVQVYRIAVVQRVSRFRAWRQRWSSLWYLLCLCLIGCWRRRTGTGLWRCHLTSSRKGRGGTNFRQSWILATWGGGVDGWRRRAPGDRFDWWWTKGEELHTGWTEGKRKSIISQVKINRRCLQEKTAAVSCSPSNTYYLTFLILLDLILQVQR